MSENGGTEATSAYGAGQEGGTSPFESRSSVGRLEEVCSRVVLAPNVGAPQWESDLVNALFLLSRELTERESIEFAEFSIIMRCNCEIADLAVDVHKRVRHLFRSIFHRCDTLAASRDDWRSRLRSESITESVVKHMRDRGFRRLWGIANSSSDDVRIEFKTALQELAIQPFNPAFSESEVMVIEHALLLICARKQGLAERFAPELRALLTVLRQPLREAKRIAEALANPGQDIGGRA